jgi:hypothetical protein
MKAREYKISGMGWLTIKMPNDRWVPVFELTDDQVKELQVIQSNAIV